MNYLLGNHIFLINNFVFCNGEKYHICMNSDRKRKRMDGTAAAHGWYSLLATWWSLNVWRLKYQGVQNEKVFVQQKRCYEGEIFGKCNNSSLGDRWTKNFVPCFGEWKRAWRNTQLVWDYFWNSQPSDLRDRMCAFLSLANAMIRERPSFMEKATWKPLSLRGKVQGNVACKTKEERSFQLFKKLVEHTLQNKGH